MNPTPNNIRWLAIPGLLFAGLWTLLFFVEWYKIGVIANPATIESYHFGSDPMVGYGGDHYRSAELYARTALIEGICALAMAGVFVLVLVRRSSWLLIAAYSLLFLGIVVHQVLF